jgi:hypothetical protein
MRCWVVELLLARERGRARWTQSVVLTFSEARAQLIAFEREGRSARLECLCARCQSRTE